MTGEPGADRLETHFVWFLPFLRLKSGYSVAGVTFEPLRNSHGRVPDVMASGRAPIAKILSSYTDRRGRPFDNCVVATIPGRGWDLTFEDGPTVHLATSLLFLAAWSVNNYFVRGGDTNVSSASFRLTGQRYSGEMPDRVSVSSRLRDGATLDGGYRHGELKFHVPLQCSVRGTASVDEGLLAALDAVGLLQSPTIQRLRSAMAFVALANTNDDFMTVDAEAILMASAFDQLLLGGHRSSARSLARKFASLFSQFGSVKTEEAVSRRSGISLDPRYVEAQKQWWVHRKWMEELYDARSHAVHTGTSGSRQWGWQLHEHMVMAAHVFPLAVKLLLQHEGHYALTDDDAEAATAVDKLLATTGWDGDEDEGIPSAWAEVMSDVRREGRMRRVYHAVKATLEATPSSETSGGEP